MRRAIDLYHLRGCHMFKSLFSSLFIWPLCVWCALAFFAQDAAASFLYTYQPNFNSENEQTYYYSSSMPTRRSSRSGATTAYTSSGAPTGLPLSVAATSGGGGYVSSSYIEPVDSRIYPVDSRIYPVDSVITHSSSVMVPVDSRIYPSSSVITHLSDNRTCVDYVVPTCGSGSVLVYYQPDANGCNISPQCQYVGSNARYR